MYLELQDIKKSYGSGDTRTLVLKGISLSLEKGTICVLLGPSGSGKSTLLNIIGGIDSADSGTITIDGQSVGKMNEKQLTSYRRRNLGYIFQSYNLIPNLTVRENIEVGAYLGDSPLDLDELISVLGLENHQDKLPSQLSGGQQQRTALQLYYAETGPQDPDDEL
ncbi:MAG: ATP-binding cassette domain-containing protein [Lachnospiraceae bacterium]|nr:ATP-binding cassette domain-containing protein [Lachnospiraceae bacterium]